MAIGSLRVFVKDDVWWCEVARFRAVDVEGSNDGDNYTSFSKIQFTYEDREEVSCDFVLFIS